jgi:hypothetical protein
MVGGFNVAVILMGDGAKYVEGGEATIWEGYFGGLQWVLREDGGDEECWGSGGEAEEDRLAWWALAKNWYAMKNSRAVKNAPVYSLYRSNE